MADHKKRSIKTEMVMIVLIILGMALFLLSYTTGYYVFGQMHSIAVLICMFAAVAAELYQIFECKVTGSSAGQIKERTYIIRIGEIILLSYAVGMILMDRIEAVGNCVVTDFDSGHGGEEAVYLCLVAILFCLAAVVLQIVKNFRNSGTIKVVETDAD